MLNRTDTDDTDNEQQHDRCVNTSSRISQNKDFNSMAKNLIDSTASISPAAEHVVIEAQGMDGEIYTVIQNSQGTANTQQLSSAQVSYVNDQTTVSNELLLVVLQNQDKIMKKLGEISVHLEEKKKSSKKSKKTIKAKNVNLETDKTETQSNNKAYEDEIQNDNEIKEVEPKSNNNEADENEIQNNNNANPSNVKVGELKTNTQHDNCGDHPNNVENE
ncbi:hypothetical protein evm_004378 [Chilo suppressalis]|nr:hypothetical protein evm_004378 [Chilo suppressalis]